MYDNNFGIDLSEIPEISGLSKGRKNPHAEKIKKEGYSITIRYSPEEVFNDQIDDTKEVIQALVDLMPVDDARRLLMHIKDNYNVPCSPHIWEGR